MLIGVALMATDKDTKLDQALYIKSIVIEGMGSLDVRNAFKPHDPRICLLPRQGNEQVRDSSSFLYVRILGKFVFLTRILYEMSQNVTDEMRIPSCDTGGDYNMCFAISVAGTTDVCNKSKKGTEEEDIDIPVGYSDSDWGQYKGYLLLIDRWTIILMVRVRSWMI